MELLTTGNTKQAEISTMTLAERIATERIEKTPAMPFTVKRIAKNPNLLRFDLTIQRNLRWTIEQKSALIESILLGFPIPPVYTLKSPDNQLWLLDGKQRLTTLIQYKNNEFELSELPEVYGVDISGLKFDQLPEEFKDLIDDQNVNFYQFDRLTTNQRDELFKRLNSGTPLSAIELTRSILGSDNLEFIDTIINKPFFTKVAMSDKQKDKYTDQELVLQCIAVITDKEYNLSGKSMRDFALDLRTKGLTEDEKTLINNTFDYLSAAFAEIDEKIAKKALKKNDIVAISAVSVDVTDQPQTFGNVIATYIASQKSGSAYKATSTGGSAKPENVKKRIEILRGVVAIG